MKSWARVFLFVKYVRRGSVPLLHVALRLLLDAEFKHSQAPRHTHRCVATHSGIEVHTTHPVPPGQGPGKADQRSVCPSQVSAQNPRGPVQGKWSCRHPGASLVFHTQELQGWSAMLTVQLGQLKHDPFILFKSYSRGRQRLRRCSPEPAGGDASIFKQEQDAGRVTPEAPC
ncbi:hypothetical protein H1C71_027063 [Ictidomys tridecemlineatus]|nr:hypothetical protein H1C71_027063 [Ictidomys tridecemlineatus]